MTAQDLIDRGVRRDDALGHAGTWTLTFRDGEFADPTCPGSTYTIEDERVVITLGTSGEGCGTAAGKVLFSSGWQLEGTRMTFTDVRSGHGSDGLAEALFGRTFEKIG